MGGGSNIIESSNGDIVIPAFTAQDITVRGMKKHTASATFPVNKFETMTGSSGTVKAPEILSLTLTLPDIQYLSSISAMEIKQTMYGGTPYSNANFKASKKRFEVGEMLYNPETEITGTTAGNVRPGGIIDVKIDGPVLTISTTCAAPVAQNYLYAYYGGEMEVTISYL